MTYIEAYVKRIFDLLKKTFAKILPNLEDSLLTLMNMKFI